MASNSSGTSRSWQSFLSRIPVEELKLYRVAVKRNNITTSVSPGPIDRSIDDPKHLIPLVHIKTDGSRRSKGIFNRDDIVVNQDDTPVSKEPENPSTSVTYSRSLPGTSGTRSPSRERRDDVDREEGSSRSGRERRPEKEKGRYHSRPYSRDRDEERYRKRSLTPLRPGEYRPTHVEHRRRSSSRGREQPRDKYKRSRSRSADYQKPSTSRKQSRSPHKRSVSPFHERDRQKSPRYNHSKKGRSRSPSKSDKPISGDKRGREPSPGYKESSRRRSRSPNRYERERRRSRSPPRYAESSRSKGSPGRYEKYPPRRHSRSPGRYDSRRHSSERRCTSPHPPIVTFSRSRSDHRRSSRSPGYERDRPYHKHRRSRSRSPRKRRSRSPHEGREHEYAFYEGIPGAEYWIPGPIRPGFPGIPRYYPPAFFPRIPGAPIILPPRIPMVAPYPPPYRQRLPVYNSKQKLKGTISGPLTSDGAVSTTGGGEDAGQGGSDETGEGNGIVQEVTDSEGSRIDRKDPEDESRGVLHDKD